MPTRPTPPAPVVRRVHELADFAARRHGDRPFLLRRTPAGWEGFGFADAARAVRAFAARLAGEGVRSGARVGLQAENRPEWGIAYLAILRCGAVVVPLDAQLQDREVGEILASAEATHCVVSARLRPVAEAARARRLPALRLLSLDAEADLPHLPGAIAEPVAGPGPDSDAGPDDLAVLIFTSGTTGQPKGVMLSHANLLSNVEAVARAFEVDPGDRFLSVLPLHHTFECTAGFLCALRVGASVAYARGLKSTELREDIGSSRATLFLGVPLLYEKLLAGLRRGIADAPAARRLTVRTLLLATRLARLLTGRRVGGTLLRPVREAAGMGRIRMLVSGAAPLASEVFGGLTDLGFTVIEGYGLTETSPVVSCNRVARPMPGTVGWPVPGVEVWIADPDENGNGEIAVRGPNVMLGYYRQPELTAEVLRDGWFHTGDLGQLAADGRLRITGRLKNMIATAAGKKIYPEEVEAALGNCPYILEVVVVGGRDARGEREEVQAHVFPDLAALERHARELGKPFDEAWAETLLRREVERCCRDLAPYKRVKRIHVRREEFPKTTTGKIRRQGLAAPAAPARHSAVA